MKKVFLLLAALLFSASAQAQVVKLATVEQSNAAAAGVYAGKDGETSRILRRSSSQICGISLAWWDALIST